MKKIAFTTLLGILILVFASFSNFQLNAKSYSTQDLLRKNQLSENMISIESKTKRLNLFNLIQAHIDINMNENEKKEINDVKELKDFTGTTYTLFELNPIGYIIYHNDSGIIFEYATNSKSPYLNYQENLYYGGMMNYYCKKNNIYYNTLIENEIIFEKDSDYLKDNSKIIYQRNVNMPNQNNLDYVDGKIKFNNLVLSLENEKTSTYSNDQPLISMESFFQPLSSRFHMGYIDVGNGVCGYIAASLVLAYNSFAYDDLLVSDTYVNKTNRTLNGGILTRELIRQDGKDPTADNISGTTADSMGDCVRNYLKNVSSGTKSWKVTTWWGTINSKGAINKNQPPILFGNLKEPSTTNVDDISNATAKGSVNHAVVAYGTVGSSYRVHYGWLGYSDVILNYNAIGGTMILSYF